MTRVLWALFDGLKFAALAAVIAAAGVGIGFGFVRWVLVPFHDLHHLAHWAVVTTIAALVLLVAMAVTSHHRSTR